MLLPNHKKRIAGVGNVKIIVNGLKEGICEIELVNKTNENPEGRPNARKRTSKMYQCPMFWLVMAFHASCYVLLPGLALAL